MDTGAAVAKEKAGLNISKFIISGASKVGVVQYMYVCVKYTCILICVYTNKGRKCFI